MDNSLYRKPYMVDVHTNVVDPIPVPGPEPPLTQQIPPQVKKMNRKANGLMGTLTATGLYILFAGALLALY